MWSKNINHDFEKLYMLPWDLNQTPSASKAVVLSIWPNHPLVLCITIMLGQIWFAA